MKKEYKLKEVFDEKSKTLDEKLIEVFINFLIEKVNKSSSSMYLHIRTSFWF